MLVELGIGEHDAIERIEQAIDYWQERCPERTASALCLDHVSSVLTFLAEADIPVRFCLLAKKKECRQYTLYRSLSTIVQRCPALLMASINDDLIPMFALFDELQIRGMNQWRCGVADGWVVVFSGTPRTSICVSEPRLLLEGQKDAIRHIVMSLRRLGIHESRVHRLIGACPLILMESIESFNEALIRLSCLFASEEDLILSIDSCPHLILNSELRFNVKNGHCHIMMKKCRVYTGSTPSVEDNSDDARRGASVRAKRAQTAHQGSEEVRTYLRVVYRIRVDDSRNQVDTPILPSASHTQVEVHVRSDVVIVSITFICVMTGCQCSKKRQNFSPLWPRDPFTTFFPIHTTSTTLLTARSARVLLSSKNGPMQLCMKPLLSP